MSNIIALIPARSGSKGVPNKNIRQLGGHSLLSWSINACLKSQFIQRIIISTDSQAYADHAISLGAEAPFLRPSNLSEDYSTDYEFVTHAIEWLESQSQKPEYIVHIRPTTPLRNPTIVDQAIEMFVESATATSLRSVHLMAESAYKTFEILNNGFLALLGSDNLDIDAANISRQLFPDTYSANGYVDVLSVKFIESSGLLHGSRVIPFITPYVDEVDTEEDLSRLAFKVYSNPAYTETVFGVN